MKIFGILDAVKTNPILSAVACLSFGPSFEALAKKEAQRAKKEAKADKPNFGFVFHKRLL